jgi:hypothetical protein
MAVVGKPTTVLVNPETEQGKRHLDRFEQARQQALERARRASQSPAPTKATKPPTES